MTDKPQFDGKKVKVKLADVCTLTMGQSPSSNSYNEIGNGIPFFQGNADFGEEAPVPRVWCTDPKKTAEGGDLLISVRAPIGAVNMAVERCCIGRGVAAIHPNDDSISVDFLKHQLLSKRRELETMGTGSTFKAVGKKSLGNLTLVLYPEDTQHEIERCLNQIKKQIKAISSQSSKLDSLVKSRFVEMFGDPCDANGNKAKVKVASICELRIGPFGSALHKNDYISGGHPLINPSHIIGSSIIPDADLTVSDDKYKSLEAYHLLPGDIVLGRRGEIGRCAVVQDKGFLCGTGSMVLRPRAGVRSEYLQRVVSFPSFRQALERNAVGVTMKNLNAKIVGAADMCLPSINQQDDFISFTKQVDKSRFVAQQQIEKLQMLYDSLAQEYFGD